MLLLLATHLLLAAATSPERQAASLVVGSGEVRQLASSVDGERVVMVAGSRVVVLDVATWETLDAAPCTVTGAALVEGLSDDPEVWVGCADGTLRPHALRDGALVPLTDLGDGGVIQALGDEVVAVHFGRGLAGASRVYAVGRDDGIAALRVAVVNPAEARVEQTLVLLFDGYAASAIGPSFLYVAHGDAFISTVNLASGLPAYNLGGGLASFRGLAPTSRGSALVASRRDDGFVAEYSGFTNLYTTVVAPAPGIRAVGTFDPGVGSGFALLAYDARAEVWTATEGAITGSAPIRSFTIDGGVNEIVALTTGYSVAAMGSGRALVWTNRPWIDALSLSSTEVREGDVVELTFRTDVAGDAEIALGGAVVGGGALVARGPASAGENVVSIPVDQWPDGESRLFVRVTDASGRVGHAATPVVVQAAPRAVTLTAGSVSFSDGALGLTFPALADPDIARYDVYVTTEPFDPSEWPEGGPPYAGPDDLETPVAVPVDGSDPVRVTISPLTNETTYYLAVRAVDAGGLEGPMSDVVEGRPRPTRTAAELAGERGGMDCDGVASGGSAWLAAFAVLAARARRRRGALLAGLLAVSLGALAVTPAAAIEDENEDGIDDRLVAEEQKWRDQTDAWANLEVRYGVITLQDENLTAAYGTGGNNVLFVELGPQLFRFFELDFGAGLFQEKGVEIDDAGLQGSQETRLTILPLAITPVLRLHLLDEQPVVPYFGAGIDWWLWNERTTDVTGAKSVMSGSKFGWHFGGGINVLLDIFDRPRASMLEAQSGINDSWLTIEYRRQRIPGTQGLSFSGDVVTAGLKVDF